MSKTRPILALPHRRHRSCASDFPHKNLADAADTRLFRVYFAEEKSFFAAPKAERRRPAITERVLRCTPAQHSRSKSPVVLCQRRIEAGGRDAMSELKPHRKRDTQDGMFFRDFSPSAGAVTVCGRVGVTRPGATGAMGTRAPYGQAIVAMAAARDLDISAMHDIRRAVFRRRLRPLRAAAPNVC
jgi:hypothetical protein